MEQDKGNKKERPFWLKIVLSLCAMCVIGLLAMWLSTYWLDFWTHHGDYVTVPDVKGMHYDRAYELLDSEDFDVVLHDSVYEDGVAPGTVIEQNPRPMMEVKPGRTVYLTINAFSPRTVRLPVLTDISVRQAKSILEGLGITNVTIKEVPSEYEDLVFSALCDGKRLRAGERVPLTAHITLEVGVALQYDTIQTDTLNVSDDGLSENVTTSPEPTATPAPEPVQSPENGDDDPSFFD